MKLILCYMYLDLVPKTMVFFINLKADTLSAVKWMCAMLFVFACCKPNIIASISSVSVAVVYIDGADKFK